jgi:hypothetical protein
MAKAYPAELIFVAGYLAFFACYNFDGIARSLPRYALPVYPFLLFSAQNWLPKRRLVLWILVIASALLASADLVGFKTVFGFAVHG